MHSSLARRPEAPEQLAPPPATPSPLRLRGLRAEIRRRILRARAFERIPPEEYGFSVSAATWLYLITTLFYRFYFRTKVFGIENLPPGPVLLIGNHGSHVLGWDGANILTASLLAADPPRLVHGMGEHRLMELPILGKVARRIGAVDGQRETCIRLLRSGGAVLTFPEGARALARPFRDRYRLVPFGHGFVHVALATGAPIVPVAVIGCEEEAPMLANPAWLCRLIRTPVAPLTATLVVPFPVRYRLHFGEPIRVSGPATEENVAREVARARGALEDLIAHGLATREHVFF